MWWRVCAKGQRKEGSASCKWGERVETYVVSRSVDVVLERVTAQHVRVVDLRARAGVSQNDVRNESEQ